MSQGQWCPGSCNTWGQTRCKGGAWATIQSIANSFGKAAIILYLLHDKLLTIQGNIFNLSK